MTVKALVSPPIRLKTSGTPVAITTSTAIVLPGRRHRCGVELLLAEHGETGGVAHRPCGRMPVGTDGSLRQIERG